jgi:transcriptional regulator with GAF, ATPase, and Fis domain
MQVQAKLLRAVETREVVPLGASEGERVELRICVATHRDLRTAVAEGRFRQDLYYRLAPPQVTLPPLRERQGEITRHVVQEIERVSTKLTPHVRLIEACLVRTWPGNVRELRREIHQSAARAVAEGADRVRLEHLSPHAGQGFGREANPADAGSAADADGAQPQKRPYVRWGSSMTRERIEQALAEADGSVANAARALGMHRAQLYREMERWSVRPPPGKPGRG